MEKKYLAMGEEMIHALGFEQKNVILFFKALEEKRYFACELHYQCYKRGLTK